MRRRRRRGPSPLLPLALLAAGVLGLWLLRPATPDRAAQRAEAREANAAIPFASDRLAAARPFRFHGTPAAREQAIRCLATAALYEAGSDRDGQRAVMQVILNRVRRRGYPGTVCGVVYQGAGLPTGCQFSFTCDRSEARRPEHRGWEAARRAARRALAGRVYAAVGTATHYHADWVVPGWIADLDKVARVGAHIFYQPRRAAAARQAAAE